MYSGYQERDELEDELYREEEEDSEGSEASSELEFHLYSQIHYSANLEESNRQTDSEPSGLLSCNEDGLQEHSKLRKREEIVKRWKVEGHRANLTPSSTSVCDDVIVIDSGTEVITLSEDDTDNGVCALSGLKSKSYQVLSSTPVQQTARKLRRSSSLDSVVLLDSATDLGENGSESTSESGSDILKSWMILGRAERAEDRSISLNMEGESDSSAEFDQYADGNWLVSHKDKEARIFNRDKGARLPVWRRTNRYYEGKNVTCRSCNKIGHLSKNCPTPKKVISCFLCGTPGHQISGCPNRLCNNCNLPGHLYESCSEKPYWHKQCHRCGMTGHFFDACPEIWRQYHITTEAGPPRKQEEEDTGRSPPFCYNCSQKGHFGFKCKKQRMFNGTYPSTPFINYYDNMVDIRRRENRIRFKFQALQENSQFPRISKIPHTPGPPKKKTKANHHPSHKSHLASNNKYLPHPADSFLSDGKHGHVNNKTKKGSKHNKNSGAPGKSWKPKRPVPKTKPQAVVATTPARRVVNEEDYFPRGHPKAGNKKKEKTNKGRHSENLFGRKGTLETNRKNNRNRRRERNTANRAAAEMYPSDENLFTIKQRKRKR